MPAEPASSSTGQPHNRGGQDEGVNSLETLSRSAVENVARSGATSPSSHARVRFSTEIAKHNNDEDEIIGGTATYDHKDGNGGQLSYQGTQKPEKASQSAVAANADAASHRSKSATRRRGYSLRRSLFAQNIERRDANADLTIELDHPGRDAPLSISEHEMTEGGKADDSFAISTSELEQEESTSEKVRLPNPALNLPLYQRWLSKQNGRRPVSGKLSRAWSSIKDRMSPANTIPQSVDGRHVKVNPFGSVNPIDERINRPYVNNIIRSCRYTPLNFVPLQLVAQFRKLANFYFLVVSVMQMIPGLSTTGTYTTIIPLLIFVGISMAKEGYDDIRRNRLDKEENERSVGVLRQETSQSDSVSDSMETSVPINVGRVYWQTEKWQDLRVGDVLMLKRNCPVPADVVLLRSEASNGFAYIETKSLDGETNMKAKRPLASISCECQTPESIAALKFDFVVEDPNLDLYRFDGRVSLGEKTLPLTNNEVIYRGSILRNTSSAVGLVIYSGEECKIRMNANKVPRVKAPSLQAIVNKVVIIIALMVLFIAIIMSIAYRIWRKTTEDKSWYLLRARVAVGQILASFIIMFNTMLPLSLYVSLEIVKVAQMFLMNDVDMYDPESDTPMEPHTSTINEELGQVSYIFSDKTGTLTNNSMRFRKLSIAGTAWLHDRDLQDETANEADRVKLRHKKRGGKGKAAQAGKRAEQTDHHMNLKSDLLTSKRSESGRPSAVDTDWHPSVLGTFSLHSGKTEELIDHIQRRPQTTFGRRVRFLILALALCHTCQPEKDDNGEIEFQAASPDELALVTAARDMGYLVTDRQPNAITIKTYPNGDEGDPVYESFEILDVIEFSSTRKRMSIIVRFPDHRICLLTKGADTTIRDFLRQAEKANDFASAVQRRADQRRSLEAQEALRRRSGQARSGSIHAKTSIGHSAGSTGLGRNSSVSLGRKHSVRDSIDHWLKERERDVDLSVARHSSQYYSPRPSAQIGSSRLSGNLLTRRSATNLDEHRGSLQSEEVDDLIDESAILDEDIVFERCFQHIDDFATEGLRTLLFAYRFVSEDEYKGWKDMYINATTSLIDRQEKVEKAGSAIETNLELLGATAIEDKLQKGVPDAVERFRRAGIKMWMLTGDKRETAINIGHSCRLIKDYSTTVILDHELGNLSQRLGLAVTQFSDTRMAHGVLVVDGQTLTQIYEDPASKALFTDLAVSADSVICCRASPSQKAALVKTIRTKVKGSVTLAIGDGANDVAMIQEAHVGIGIAGKEGLQAARTSDYSIAQFRFLLKLLLVHGRWNYVRICKYTLGTFWKEMLFYLVQAMYQRWTGYTGTSLYEPWSLSMFNTLFTSLPVIFMGVFEKDLAASTLLAVPELYSLGQRNGGFNLRLYAWWALLGASEAAIVYFTVYHIYGKALFTRDNQLYAMGALAFSACVTIISLKIQVIELHNKSVAAAIAILLSVGGWWVWNLLLSGLYPQNVVYNVNHGLLDRFGRNPLWWLTLTLIVVGVILLEITVKSVSSAIWPTDVDTFQAYEQDIEVRKRFEEAAADLLQQGWNRGSKKSSLELLREAKEQTEREAQVQELLERPRQMRETSREPRIRQRHSVQLEDGSKTPKQGAGGEPGNITPRKSLDIGELFSKGFGSVKKGPDLR